MIHQKEIFKKIGAIIVEINEQYQYLSENPEQLNDLELELFSANADFLSEHVKILRRINNSTARPQPASTVKFTQTVSTPPPGVEPVNDIDEKEETQPTVVHPTPEINFEPLAAPEVPEPELEAPKREAVPARESVEVPRPEPVIAASEIKPESVPSMIYEPKAEELVPPTIQVVETPKIQQELQVEIQPAENVTNVEISTSGPKQTLNDIISAQKAQNIQTTHFSGQPISDLKTAISLNDKLLFIKDLFNGYSLAYTEAIEILNRFDSFEIAETFLKTNYATKNNWATKQASVDKFYEILHRRYAK